MKCEVCGKDTPYFIETYEPAHQKLVTLNLCERHLMTINIVIKMTIDELQCRNRMVEVVKGVKE